MLIRKAVRDMSVAIKLFGIMGLLALTAAAVGWAGMDAAHRYNQRIAVMQRASERAVTGEQINGLINAVVMDSRGIYMAKDRAQVEKFAVPLLASLTRIEERMTHWKGLVEPDGSSLFDECMEQLRGFVVLRRELVEAARTQGAEAASSIGNNDANRTSRERLNKAVIALAQHNADDVGRLADELAQFEQTMSRFLPLFTAACIGIVAVLAVVLIIGGIVRPLTRITAAMRRLADGDPGATVVYHDQADEIGMMATALEVFRLQAVENQRLTLAQRQQREEAEEQKRVALVNMVETVEASAGRSIQQISLQSEALAATANEMRERADRTGVSATSATVASATASANVATVCTAATQLGTSIRQINQQIELSVQTIAQAVDAGQEARLVIDALNQRVGQIADVADMINEIASRTNLLALNATIEAARAGEAGKGFAVVASEVKQLASQTAGSTRQIGQHIADIRAATAAAVNAVARIDATIGEISQTSKAITTAVEDQGKVTAEIARNVAETVSAVGEITDRNLEVSKEAELGGRQAEVVMASAQDLTAAVRSLKEAIIRTVRGSTDEVNRRFFDRIAISLPCCVDTPDGAHFQSRTIDLSEGGARLEGGFTLAAGSRGKLQLDQFQGSVDFVVLSGDANGIRMSFELQKDAEAAFRGYVERLRTAKAAA
jgi:methyl-accepting chemotaxis protein